MPQSLTAYVVWIELYLDLSIFLKVIIVFLNTVFVLYYIILEHASDCDSLSPIHTDGPLDDKLVAFAVVCSFWTFGLRLLEICLIIF